MSNEFSTKELIRRARLATNDNQRIFRANITFMNTNKGSENYESHQYVTVNGRNYRIFDGKDHIVPEELVEALKDAVGYKSVQTRAQDLAGGVNYDDPEDAYQKIKIENYMIQIIEEVTPPEVREKIRKRREGNAPILSDEQEEAASRKASINVSQKPVQEVEKEVFKVVYPEDNDVDTPELIDTDEIPEYDLGTKELEID